MRKILFQKLEKGDTSKWFCGVRMIFIPKPVGTLFKSLVAVEG